MKFMSTEQFNASLHQIPLLPEELTGLSDYITRQCTDSIDRFEDDYSFLSNFYPSEITYDGITYPTVEHAFQAMKSVDIEQRKKIAVEKTPGRAKLAGREVKLRPYWDSWKFDLMYELLLIKFEDPELRQKLLDTGSNYLVEGNFWHDNIWGECHCFECTSSNRPGANMLGRLLMIVRERIKGN